MKKDKEVKSEEVKNEAVEETKNWAIDALERMSKEVSLISEHSRENKGSSTLLVIGNVEQGGHSALLSSQVGNAGRLASLIASEMIENKDIEWTIYKAVELTHFVKMVNEETHS